MKSRTVDIKDDCAYIIPIGDLHMGDKAFGKESRKIVEKHIKWVQDTPNARVILNGDLVNTATRASKTSPFEQDMDLQEQVQHVVDLLTPIKDKIVGAVCGNHEQRIIDFAGFDPTISILSMLGLKVEDIYFKNCGIIKFKVGKRMSRGSEVNRVAYTVVFHHTTGGGNSVASKLGRIDKMTHTTVSNADIYIGSHNHSKSTAIKISNEFDSYNNTVIQRKQVLVSAGGYLEWNGSYAEAKQLEPMDLGSPTIKLDGKTKDIRVDLN